MRLAFLLLSLTAFLAVNDLHAQDQDGSTAAQRIEILELKLKLAEQQIAQLEKECETLRKENAKLENADAPAETTKKDPFAAGVVWVGKVAFYGTDQGRLGHFPSQNVTVRSSKVQ